MLHATNPSYTKLRGIIPSDNTYFIFSVDKTKLQAQLKSRGAHGIHGLGRKFRIMDDDGSKSLSMAEANGCTRSGQLGSHNHSALPQRRQKCRRPSLTRAPPSASVSLAR